MMRAAVLGLLAACSAASEPDIAFVSASHVDVERALDSGVRAIVVEPVPGIDAADLVGRAHERGVRVIALGAELVDRDDGDASDAVVAFDGYRVGTEHAAAAVAAIGKGTVAVLTDEHAIGYAAEVARGYLHTLAPYIARGDISLVDDATAADAVLSTSGARVRGLAGRFVASASGDNADRVCAGAQQLDVRFDRTALASAATALARRLVAGEDLDKDPTTVRLPGRRTPVEVVRVDEVTARECAAP